MENFDKVVRLTARDLLYTVVITAARIFKPILFTYRHNKNIQYEPETNAQKKLKTLDENLKQYISLRCSQTLCRLISGITRHIKRISLIISQQDFTHSLTQ